MNYNNEGSEMNFYQHHIGDFKKDTDFLSHEDRSIYLELIWMYYDQEQPLVNDVPLLARKSRARPEQVEDLLKLFFIFKDDAWHHTRIDAELQSVYERSEKAREAAQARWNNANAMQTHTKRNANAMLPNTHNPEPKDIYSSEFKRFWSNWPKHQRKTKQFEAWKSWKKQKLDSRVDEIIYHVQKSLMVKESWKEGFIPLPVTYLNQKQYLDTFDSHDRSKKPL